MVQVHQTTSSENNLRTRCFTLRTTLGSLMVGLLVLLGVAIIFFSMNSQKKSIQKSTGEVFRYAAIQTREKLAALTSPVETFVELSAQLDRLGINEQHRFQNFLPYMFQSLKSTPWISSVYIGYENGEFFMLQRLDHEHPPADDVSEDALYFLKRIVIGEDGSPEVSFLYFDSELYLVSQQQIEYQGYDPRKRPWYVQAINNENTVVTPPYVYFTTGSVGITAAHRLSGGHGVVGADSMLKDLLVSLQVNKLTPSTEIVVFNRESVLLTTVGTVEVAEVEKQRIDGSTLSIALPDLQSDIMAAVEEKFEGDGAPFLGEIEGKKDTWFVLMSSIGVSEGQEIYLVLASPYRELMVQATKMITQSVMIVVVALLLAVGAALVFSGKIASPLHGLSRSADAIRDFRLEESISVSTRIAEVNNLAASMSVMQSAINRFVEIARALSAEKDMGRILEMILREVSEITNADGGGIALARDEGNALDYVLVKNTKSGVHRGGTSSTGVDLVVELADQEIPPIEHVVIKNRTTLVINDVSWESEYSFASIQEAHEMELYRVRSLLLIPLLNRSQEVLGVLTLVNCRDSSSGELVSFSKPRVSYVEALSSNAALALDNNRLIKAQKDLFDSFVKLLAGAIDTKSPYTGGHCQRVPEIALLLADAAQKSDGKPFADFILTEEEQHELYVASWLHDCGKITTPEHVVDKATKLEGVYDRIHEIRMRFEVLHRDAQLSYYQELLERPEKEVKLRQQMEKRWKTLQEDFEFVAQCNLGGESLNPANLKRLHEIGCQVWLRHFDNGLGVVHETLERHPQGLESLPVVELLLSDRPEHIVSRTNAAASKADNRFCMEVPEHAYNFGELYNLSIVRGTLTKEERYAVNDHIVQTISMLKRLPFPKDLKRVPEWAGNHHEKLDGTGYPRCLKGDELSIPERIMVVADIFEALTAADRPYQEPRKLSDCLRIMSRMCSDGDICPDIFGLLLTSGVYLEYARKYMRSEQVDSVEIGEYLSKLV